jgi:PAS domain S-box-containing protein
MAEMFGYPSPDDLIGQHGTVIVASSERDRLRRYYEARLHGGPAPCRYEFEATRRDGSALWIESLVSIVSWKGGPAVLVTFLDVTERHRAAEAERQAAALRSVTWLAYTTAHEINNPLAIIMGNCELLAGEVDPRCGHRVTTMLRAVQRIQKIVTHMSHITRLELSYHSPNLPPMLDLQRSSAAVDGSGSTARDSSS